MVWSLEVLIATCDPVIVAAPSDHLTTARAALEDWPEVVLVEGGNTRRASVAAALAMVETARVVVHDAARPFLTTKMVESALAALKGCSGVVTAVPVDETLKQVSSGSIRQTMDRTSMWRAQTPQVFYTEVLLKAHEAAAAQGFEGTDDAQLVERLGEVVRVVEGSSSNLKVTRPEDFELAEAMLRIRD